MSLTIYLGYKNYSSWSLRAWLALARTGAAYEERVFDLTSPAAREEIRRIVPTGRVPALRDGDLLIWDSLAIGEYLAERFPQAGLWPSDRAARATARAVTAEMHSGFLALRSHMPMNIRRSSPGRGRTAEVAGEIERVATIWRTCRERHGEGGPFLFGDFGLADAFWAPVVTRFRTYGVDLDDVGRAYADAVWSWPAMRAWAAAASTESFSNPAYDL